ncbi:cell division protein FtsW [Candidatus Saccharibacteria bacterium]|nr:cell division protein FtsW [Candidatus Saccharibacteria bacterium]
MNPRLARHTPNQLPVARKHRPDYGLFITASILLAVGLIVMYAISPALAAQGGDVSDTYFVVRQLIAVVIGIGAFFIFSKISVENWSKWHKALIISAIVLSLGTIVTGGLANRWIQLGAFSFQTVEYVKLVVIIVFAGYLSQVIDKGKLTDIHAWRVPMIIASVLALIVVIIQRDLGSAAVLFTITLAMLYMAGFPLAKLTIAITIIAILGVLAVVSTPYRRDRVLTFLQPTADCSDAGYHSCQALIAVGSGGVMGVGLGRSIQAYGYLPEAENDSIFAIYAEKFGFIGSVALLGLYGSLLLRILTIMQRAPNRTMQLMSAGVFTWFAVQGTINIAAMLGLIPLKGITLPFISYGGTSLIFSMAALGIVFHISKYTLMRKATLALPKQEGDAREDNHHWRRDSRPRYTVTRRSL